MVWSDQSQFPFYVIDNNGNVILTIDSTGFHLDGAAGHIDMQVSGGQPTIFFNNPARTSQAFINAPILGGKASIALDSAQYTAPTLPGSPTIVDLLWLKAGSIDIGEAVPGGNPLFVGGHLNTTDSVARLQLLNAAGNVVDMVNVNASGILIIDSNNNGFGLSLTTGYLHRVVNGVYQGWNPLSILYQNGWADLGGNWATGQYKVSPDGWVNFQGVIIGGTKTDGTVMWTMPAALWPAKDQICDITIISAGSASNVNARVFSANGQVQCFGISGTTNGNMALNSCRYPLI